MDTTDAQNRERHHQEDLERLRRFRPFDDTFMRGLFRDDIPLTQFVLRIILGKPDLVVTSCETQADMKRVTGARSICLDAYATDSRGTKYDIEVQRSDCGASPKRVRYHSSVMDVENLDEKQDYKELPDTYVIFITENDVLGMEQPLYCIERIIRGADKVFDDGSHILYVNGKCRDDSDLGKLMHDFDCSDASDMFFGVLAEKTRYLKETQEGVSKMCKIMEDLRDESFAEGKTEQAKATAQRLYQIGLPIEKIADAVNFGIPIVKGWLTPTVPQ